MCGIWTRTKYGKSVELDEILFPVRQLRHRGPDGYGWFHDRNLAMVHTRLSIIDLAGGSQPLASSDGRWVGIVNGELYDFEALRADLINEGVQFKTNSDSEVLLNIFAKRGAAGLTGLSGEFAFIFYDRVESRLCFGRDPFGVKPLFMDARRDSFTLASEIKALSEEAPVFDPEYLKTFLVRMMVPPRTALANAKHVLPGRVYTLDLKTKKLTWEFYQRLPFFSERRLTGRDAVERLDFELRAAVQRRLRADVEVGCYLSGGIDSALIAAIAADLGARPKAFTVGFSDRDFDESTEAAHIAADLGIEHSVVQLTAKNFMEHLIRSIVAFENPITNPHGAAKNLLSKHASSRVKVVLSGEGSDELFGGYSYLRMHKLKDFVARHPKLGLPALQIFAKRESEMSLGHLEGESETFKPLASTHFGQLTPAILLRLAKRRWVEHLCGRGMDGLVGDVCTNLSDQLRLEGHASLRGRETDLNLWIGARGDMLHYVLANVGDRQEMSNALEGRTPFLDINVAQVAGAVQEKDLVRGLTEKYVLRRVGAKYLQTLHSRRLKKPFFAPSKHLYLRENRDAINDYVERSRSETPWLNWKNIDHLLHGSKRALHSPLEKNIFAMKIALFSIGVLSEKLRASPSAGTAGERGFAPPMKVSDLLPNRKAI